jgi:hypothetical protein
MSLMSLLATYTMKILLLLLPPLSQTISAASSSSSKTNITIAMFAPYGQIDVDRLPDGSWVYPESDGSVVLVDDIAFKVIIRFLCHVLLKRTFLAFVSCFIRILFYIPLGLLTLLENSLSY